MLVTHLSILLTLADTAQNCVSETVAPKLPQGSHYGGNYRLSIENVSDVTPKPPYFSIIRPFADVKALISRSVPIPVSPEL